LCRQRRSSARFAYVSGGLRLTVVNETWKSVLVDILSGKLDVQTAINERAVTIQGDWSLLERLAFLFEPPKPVQQSSFARHAPRRRTLTALDIDLYAFLPPLPTQFIRRRFFCRLRS
jgi:hypothetical protein